MQRSSDFWSPAVTDWPSLDGHLLPLPIPSHRSSRRPLRSDIGQSPNFGARLLIDVCHRLNLKFELLV